MEAERARRVVDTFVDLAGTLSGDYDVSDLLQFLVERCTELLQVQVAGVLLEGADGALRLAAGVSDAMDQIEQLEMRLDQGPCLEAYRFGEEVVAEDLENCRERWPLVTAKLIDMGMRSAHAFPLRLRGDRIGALNMYRTHPGPFPEEDIRLAQAFADVAAVGILRERKVAQAEKRAEQLQHALDSRIVVEQAKGILAERHGLGTQEAFETIRTHARTHRRKLRDVCEQIVAGDDPLTHK